MTDFGLCFSITSISAGSGKIFLDGVDVYDVELHSLRSIFGIVTQSPFVFAGTLLENLTLGDPSCGSQLDKVMRLEEFRKFTASSNAFFISPTCFINYEILFLQKSS